MAPPTSSKHGSFAVLPKLLVGGDKLQILLVAQSTGKPIGRESTK